MAYTSQRAIVIDQTKVPGTDQASFPFLFTTVCDKLNGAITDVATAVTVTYGLQIQNGDYLRIDTEIMLVTAGGGTTSLTVTRAQLSTSGAAHSDLAPITNTFLGPTAIGGTVTSASGFDIYFSSDAAGLNKLDYERDTYSASTGQAWFWIRIPTLSNTVDTTIYVQYNNSAVVTDQTNPTAVWDSSFVAVYHCNDNDAQVRPPVTDSTAYHANLLASTGSPVTAAGQIGKAYTHAGGFFCSTSYVTYSMFLPVGSTPRTLELWIKPAGGGASQVIVQWGNNATNGQAWGLLWDGVTPNLTLYVGNIKGQTLTVTSLDGAWHHIAVVLPSGQTDLSGAQVYVDGALSTFSTSNTQALATASSGWFTLGATAAASPSANYLGLEDEVRVSVIERSADWFATSYNNQKNPGSFYTLGTASAPPASGTTVNVIQSHTSVVLYGTGMRGA